LGVWDETMLKLNGWTRLWVVISVAWLAFSGWIAYEDISNVYGTTKYEVGKDGVGNVTVVFSDAEYDSKHSVEEQWIPKISADPDKYVGKEITEPYDTYVGKNGARTVRERVAFVLLPPAFLLLLGWAIAWVRVGFSQAKPAQQGAPGDAKKRRA